MMMKVYNSVISASYIIIFTASILHTTGIARIVTKPHDVQYLFINDGIIIKCQNTSEETTNNAVRNSLWFRLLPNQTRPHQYDNSISKRVRVSDHTLVFTSTLSSDEGEYYCCAPAGEPCSDPLSVFVFVRPIIKAVSKIYTAFIGSEVSLICAIINEGAPVAIFRWMRIEKYIPEDQITTNDTHTVLKLTNLTQDSSGEYNCIADSKRSPEGDIVHLNLVGPPRMNGPRIAQTGTWVTITCTISEGQPHPDIYISTPVENVYNNESISFIATVQHTGYYMCSANISTATFTDNHYLLVYEIDNATSFISFQAIIHNGVCHFKYDSELSTILKEHIFELCGCNVNISTERFECISDGRAIYDVKLTGAMAANIKQFLLNKQLRIEIVSGSVTLYICDPSCDGSEPTDGSNEVTDVSSETDHRVTIAIWMASSALILLFTVIVIFLTYKFCKRLKLLKYLKNCPPHQETDTDATPNPYTNITRRHQNRVLYHRSDVPPPPNSAAVAISHEEQAMEPLNNVSSVENDHPVNCKPKSAKEDPKSEIRGTESRANYRSMYQQQELTSRTNQAASALTYDIVNFTEIAPPKDNRGHTIDGNTETQSEMYEIMNALKANHPNETGKKKESSV